MHMLLPSRERAVVEPKKLFDYLLNLDHPVGQSKARFFYQLGFTRNATESLEHELLTLGRNAAVIERKVSSYGTKYVIDGWIRGPSGRRGYVRTVWMIATGNAIPHLITARPHDEPKAGGQP